MKKIFYGSVMLSLLTGMNLMAEVVNLPEAAGECPATEITFLNDVNMHTVMDGKATITESWDSDKYMFTPAVAGTVRFGYRADKPISVKVDYVCGGSGLYRKADEGALKEGSLEIPVEAGQSIHIGTWDWESADGYPYDLNIEFIPQADGGDSGNDGNTTGNADNNSTGEGTDGGGDTPDDIADTIVYEDAEDGNTDGWINISPYLGSVSNISYNGSRAIQLSGTTNSEKNRASYSFGDNWNNDRDFIAKWDIESDTDYEIFFIAKSSDDPDIVNYIGYVSAVPRPEGYHFDYTTGYWVEDATGSVQSDWGRYVYMKLDDTTSLTTITADLKEDALNALGIDLLSIESMWVNVYGDATKSVILDNITLQETLTSGLNHAPVAQDRIVTVNEGESVEIVLSATDADGDELTYELVDEPSFGTISGTLPNITYTAENVDENGTDTFTFIAKDDQNESNIATVTVNIVNIPVAQNTVPVVEDINVSVDQNESADIVLKADDQDGDDLQYHYTQPAHGTLEGDAPDLTYRPDGDFNGTDMFHYYVNDGESNSSVAIVKITVNKVQEPDQTDTNDSVSIDENTSIDINCAGQMIDTPEIDRTVEIKGSLSGVWDNDRYSFVMPENSSASLLAVAKDTKGNALNVRIIKNCFEPLSDDGTGYGAGGESCHLLTVVVYGCAKDEDVEYTLTLKMTQ